ncbi:serine O-acetyltransferase [Clostridium paraputrificum]|uniref:serine O-acetyltransferase n=1 Tax=Clostridium paraputrificum TaxID=29363 RepID=UPI003563BD18
MRKIIEYLKNPTYRVSIIISFLKKYKKNKFIKLYFRKKLIKNYGIYIGKNCVIGDNFRIVHPNGVVIGDKCIIKNNVTVYHQVTLGSKYGDGEGYPTLENNVIIFPGAKIIGNITIGENSIIGPNSVVISNVESNSIYSGFPACKIKDV